MTDSRLGFLIAFDGLDSSGKETQTRELATRLRFVGHTVRELRSPDYNTISGQKLKALLQNHEEWQKLAWQDKLKLFADNRAEHRAEVERALKAGDIVVYDRYVQSSVAFITVEALETQDADLFRDEVQAVVRKVEYEENKMPREDLSIFLDVPPVVADTLLAERKIKQKDDDEYTDHLAVQQRLYNEYDLLCKAAPNDWLRVECVTGERLLGIQDISELVWTQLITWFPQLEKRP